MVSLRIIIATLAMAATSAAAEQPRVDFKVVTWYDRADPIATFQYRGYDVRKGEFSPAVDAWLATMREKHPDYKVVVRDVDLARAEGPTERRKVGAVIQGELLAAAAAEGLFTAPPTADEKRGATRPLPVRIRPPVQPWRFSQPPPMVARPGPMLIPSPVPIPYPRPHP